MNPLTPTQRRDLRARAHHLDPVVIVGHHGLTAAVLHEVDLALTAHQLLKVRVGIDAREEREAMLARICAELGCAPVQHLGKVLVLWRPNPEAAAPKVAKAAKSTGKPKGNSGKRLAILKSTERTPVDPIRARRRGRSDDEAPPRARRGAARHLPAGAQPLPEAPPEGSRRKSSFTPKTKPKSFSAKPNPRTAWEKPKPAGPAHGKSAAAGARRKTTGASGGRKAIPVAKTMPPDAGARRRRKI